jgi:hypothetical protein
LAARHAVTDLVNAHPHLWPLLNRLTLTYEHEGIRAGVNWCATLRLLERRHAAGRRPLRRAYPDTIRT